MSDRVLQHRRVHNLLLLQKFLALREGTSPFTLIFDTIEQKGDSLVSRLLKSAAISKARVIRVCFEYRRHACDGEVLIKAWNKSPKALSEAIEDAISAGPDTSRHTILLFDTLNPLTAAPFPASPSAFLLPLLKPHVSIIAIYHADIPIPPSMPARSAYAISPLIELKYIATTIMTVHSFAQTLARKRALERSLPEPLYGLAEETEGVLIGLSTLSTDYAPHISSEERIRLGTSVSEGIVLEMSYRRKSGRSVDEVYFLPDQISTKPSLLEDHPFYKPPQSDEILADDGADAITTSTFDLSLTEKQRREREGVVLPYYDAQRVGEAGDERGYGGRIVYEMGMEDDFDDEEDEI